MMENNSDNKVRCKNCKKILDLTKEEVLDYKDVICFECLMEDRNLKIIRGIEI